MAPYGFPLSFFSFLENSTQVQGPSAFPQLRVCVWLSNATQEQKDAEDLFRTITTEGKKNQPWVVCAFGGEWWWLGDDSDVNKSGKVSTMLNS